MSRHLCYHKTTIGLVVVLLFLVNYISAQGAIPTTFDPNHDNGYYAVFAYYSTRKYYGPNHEDGEYHSNPVTLKIRFTNLYGLAAWEAMAPYTKTGVGKLLGSRIQRRPVEEHTLYNQNIAHVYSEHRMLVALWPESKSLYDNRMTSLGLNPYPTDIVEGSPVDIGIKAGEAVVAHMYTDGWNQLGDMCGPQVKRMNYSACVPYKPVNSYSKFDHPDHWQPDLLFYNGATYGRFVEQTFFHPQMGIIDGVLSREDKEEILREMPRNIMFQLEPEEYIARAQEVIDKSAQLTERDKMVAELFDNKLTLFEAVHVLNARIDNAGNPFAGESLKTVVTDSFLFHQGFIEAMYYAWFAKVVYDGPRPFSVIRSPEFFGDKKIQAWAKGKGTIEMYGKDWNSYLTTDSFPEYPSGTSCVCAVLAQIGRRRMGNDTLNWTHTFKKGSSFVEPGLTPSQDFTVTFATFTEMENECARSRVTGGVHFTNAVQASLKACRKIGDKVYDKITKKYLKDELPPAV